MKFSMETAIVVDMPLHNINPLGSGHHQICVYLPSRNKERCDGINYLKGRVPEGKKNQYLGPS